MIQNVIAKTEQIINPADRIPVLGSFTGMIRLLAGTVQILAAIAFAYVKTIFLLLTAPRFKFQEGVNEGIIHCFHGFANLVRGAIAMLPGFNLLFFVYDYKIGRFNYPDEILMPGVYPIGTAKRLLQR